jgi:hypothetical protein
MGFLHFVVASISYLCVTVPSVPLQFSVIPPPLDQFVLDCLQFLLRTQELAVLIRDQQVIISFKHILGLCFPSCYVFTFH